MFSDSARGGAEISEAEVNSEALASEVAEPAVEFVGTEIDDSGAEVEHHITGTGSNDYLRGETGNNQHGMR